MPRPREPSLIEEVLTGRWPVAAAAAALAFVAFLIVPGILASSIAFVALVPLARSVALLAFAGFAAVALVKYIREASTVRTVDQVSKHLSVVERARERSRHRYPGASNDPIGPTRVEPFVPQRPPTRAEPSARPKPTEWSLALLQSIEWKRFEEVVAAYFRAKGFRCRTLDQGPDGGIDGRLYFGDLATPVGVVQCKAWTRQVGVGPVRELLGSMAHERVARGYFCATGEFSKDAIAFAASNPIKLITGRELLEAIAEMSAEAQRELLVVSTTGDYTTPTCPTCGTKLVERTIGGKEKWACPTFPRCRYTMFRRADRADSPNRSRVADEAMRFDRGPRRR